MSDSVNQNHKSATRVV